LPLQSLENIIRHPFLLPGQENTLMVLSRSSKYSDKQPEPYVVRFSLFDVWMHISKEIHPVFEVLAACPTTTKVVGLS